MEEKKLPDHVVFLIALYAVGIAYKVCLDLIPQLAGDTGIFIDAGSLPKSHRKEN